MAVTIYTNRAENFVSLIEKDATESPSDVIKVWPYPIQGGVRALYIQKCRDTVTGLWTFWIANFQDIYGSQYPGAGFDAGTYRIETISYTREQA